MISRLKSSIGRKMYLFVGITVFFVALAMALVAYWINVDQIDSYFKNLTITSARNFSSFMDPQFRRKLRDMTESEEYQALREEAEENDDDENPLYETGYYEEREAELMGVEASGEVAPVISHGDWGWLCSGYAAVYDTDGSIICHVGCDVEMDDIMAERKQTLIWMLVGALALTAAVIFIALQITNRMIVRPLNDITEEMEKFSPAENKNYRESGGMTYTIHSGDEIEAITEGIRSMQTNVVDYLNQIKKISKAAYKDPLTQFGSGS